MELTSRRFGMLPLFLLAAIFSLLAPLFWTHVEAPPGAASGAFENGEVYGRILPTLSYASSRLRDGEWPLWSPRQFCGVPFFANPVHGMLQPLNLVFLVTPAVTGLALHAFAGLFLMALFTALLLRTLGTAWIPAAIGGMVYAFGGASVSVMSSPEMLGVLIWPPVLYGIAYQFSEKYRRILVLPGGVVIALLLLAGEPLFGAILALSALLYGITRAWVRRRFTGIQIGDTLRGFAMMSAIGLALSAVQWLPFMAWVLTLEHPAEGLWPGGWSGHLPAHLSEIPAALLLPRTAVLPGMLYSGAIPLILIPAALLYRQRRFEVLYFIASAVFWIGIAVWGSDASPATDPWKVLVYPGTFAVALLTGFGADRLLLAGRDPRSPLIWGSVLLAMIFAAVLLVVGTADTRGRIAPAVLVLLPFFVLRVRWIGVMCGACLAFLLFVDLREASTNVYQHPYAGDAHWLDACLPAVREAEAQALGERILTLPASRESVLPANIGFLHPVENAGGAYWPLTRDQARWWSRLTPYMGVSALSAEPDADGPFYPLLLNYMGVRVVAGERNLPWMDKEETRERLRLRFLRTLGRLSLWKNESAHARVRWVPQWEAAADLDGAIERLVAPDFPARSTCVVTASGGEYEALLPALPPGHSEDGATLVAEARCAVARESAEEVEITADTTRPGILVLADTFAPGWHAYVNGAREPILKVNGMFRGVYLPAGKHNVTFTYAPLSVTLGLLTSGLALIGCLGWAVFTASRQLYGHFTQHGGGAAPIITPADFSGNKES
ncbi:MAG: YfhO family protein [Candidatus Hydrogenedentes bacterium]|nr:YfhO family protein [Candidatus Hydrogenedentota bacterium]